MSDAQIKKKVIEKLRTIIDPELGANIVDLGFVTYLTVNNGKVHIKLVFTTPLCPQAGYIFQKVEEEVKKIEGVKEVELEYDWETVWSPEMMSEELRKRFNL